MTFAALDTEATPRRLVLLPLCEVSPPYDSNDTRYRCLDCGEILILRWPRTDSTFTPNFSHRTTTDCTASEEQQRETLEHLEAKLRLHRWLTSKGIPAEVEPGPYGGGPASRMFRPDVGAWPGNTGIVAIEYQRSPFGVGEIADRRAAYQDYVGDGRLHLWVFSIDTAARHYVPADGRGRRTTDDAAILPTRDQRELVADGAFVCWLDLATDEALIPYSITPHNIAMADGELWSRSTATPHPRRSWVASCPPKATAKTWRVARVHLDRIVIGPDRSILVVGGMRRRLQAFADDHAQRLQTARESARQRFRQALDDHAIATKAREHAEGATGPQMTALTANFQALLEASGHEARATTFENQARSAETLARQHRTEADDWARKSRRGIVARAVRLQRRSSVEARQQTSLIAAQRASAQAVVHRTAAAEASRQAAECHPEAEQGRAGTALKMMEASWRQLAAAAIDADVAAAKSQTARIEAQFTPETALRSPFERKT